MKRRMKSRQKLILAMGLGIAACATPPAHAGLVNDVPSCYGAFALAVGPPAPGKLVYVLIDQTVRLPRDLQQSVIANVNRLIEPGSRFVVTEFSAFSQGRYLQVLHTGIVETPPPETVYDRIPISKGPQVRACFGEQLAYATKMVDAAVGYALQGATSSLDRSDIMAAIQAIGLFLRTSGNSDKVLLLVTDGLENSGVTSFYARGGIRDIDPQGELRRVQAAHMLADLAGAKVYVLGGGLMPPPAAGTRLQRDGYRDSRTLADIRRFWEEYLAKSDARLEEFGEPALVAAPKY